MAWSGRIYKVAQQNKEIMEISRATYHNFGLLKNQTPANAAKFDLLVTSNEKHLPQPKGILLNELLLFFSVVKPSSYSVTSASVGTWDAVNFLNIIDKVGIKKITL